MAGMRLMGVAMTRSSIQSDGGVVRFGLAGLLVISCLMGCASSEQIREKQAAAQATQDQADDAQCRASGAPETSAYQDCRTRLVQKRSEDQAAQERRREAFQKTTAEGTSALSGH